jgi:hypothetical protein
MKINLKECVRFKHLPKEFVPVMEALLSCSSAQGKEPTITGASFEDYPAGGYHDKGYAWDVRTFDIFKPFEYACCIYNQLRVVDPLYYILYGDKRHTDHIHIAYRIDKKR